MSDEIINRLIGLLDLIDEYPRAEYKLEVTLSGAEMLEDKRTDLDEDENPGGMFNEEYLGDMEVIGIAEFSTDLDSGGDFITVADLKELRRILSEEKGQR